MKNNQIKMTIIKNTCQITKTLVEKVVINSANTTSSLWAHQPVAPKEIYKYKK